MGRRSEQRVVIAFPVVVRGTDTRGNPFAVTTETHDVSCTGASLKGLQGLAEPGKRIEIECQNQKAWYRVQWASAANRTKEWRFGVRCLEPGKYIWGVPPKEWQPDSFDHQATNSPDSAPASVSGASAASEPPRERRRFARYACRVEVQVASDGAYGRVVVKGKITDISMSGCYIEMLSPLPDQTPIELTFNTEQGPLHLSASVRSSQEGFGMGVAFTGMRPEDFEILRQFAPPSKDSRPNAANANYGAAPAGPAPAPSGVRQSAPPATYPRSYSASAASAPEPNLGIHRSPAANELGALDLPDPASTLEALVRLLLRKKVLTRAELLEELERLKTAQI